MPCVVRPPAGLVVEQLRGTLQTQMRAKRRPRRRIHELLASLEHLGSPACIGRVSDEIVLGIHADGPRPPARPRARRVMALVLGRKRSPIGHRVDQVWHLEARELVEAEGVAHVEKGVRRRRKVMREAPLCGSSVLYGPDLLGGEAHLDSLIVAR